jgi:hypothetical protein
MQLGVKQYTMSTEGICSNPAEGTRQPPSISGGVQETASALGLLL